MNFFWLLVFAGSIQSTQPENWVEHALEEGSWPKDLASYGGAFVSDASVEQDGFTYLEAIKERKGPVSNYSTFEKDTLPACEQRPSPAYHSALFVDENNRSVPGQWQEGNEPQAVLTTEPTITDPLSIVFVPYKPPNSSSGATVAKPTERASWFPDDGELFTDSQISTWETKSSTMLSQYHYLGVIKPEKYYSQMLGSNAAMGCRMTQDRIIVLDGYSVTNPMGENLFSTWATNTLKGTRTKAHFLPIPRDEVVESADNPPSSSLESEKAQPEIELMIPLFDNFGSSFQPDGQEENERNKHPASDATGNEIYDLASNQSLCTVAAISNSPTPPSRDTNVSPQYVSAPHGTETESASDPLPAGPLPSTSYHGVVSSDSFFERLRSSSEADGEEDDQPQTRAETVYQDMQKPSEPVPRQLSATPSGTPLRNSAGLANWFLRVREHHSYTYTTQSAQPSAFFDKCYYHGAVGVDRNLTQIAGRNASMGYRVIHDRILLLGGHGRANRTSGSIKEWEAKYLVEQATRADQMAYPQANSQNSSDLMAPPPLAYSLPPVRLPSPALAAKQPRGWENSLKITPMAPPNEMPFINSNLQTQTQIQTQTQSSVQKILNQPANPIETTVLLSESESDSDFEPELERAKDSSSQVNGQRNHESYLQTNFPKQQ
ncbi:hypothetical protein PSACC_01735 [Paramicrosporidium saccamoebae]|uniref:Uncharacterized protein n=1 Tax=Paramicrosporidium saccamoebae TaxID=1246581 RepID=A0A2H9TL30_9FUNG|nr:hypothetical protein PSACC_01735 [Paramicrosporidium saccamoebae]